MDGGGFKFSRYIPVDDHCGMLYTQKSWIFVNLVDAVALDCGSRTVNPA